MAWPIGFVIGVYFFGFIFVIPIYVFTFVLFQGKMRVRQAGIAAIIATAFTWIVFEQLMNYEVYSGLFFTGS